MILWTYLNKHDCHDVVIAQIATNDIIKWLIFIAEIHSYTNFAMCHNRINFEDCQLFDAARLVCKL